MHRRTAVAVGVTVVLWASAFPAIRVALHAYPPGELALLRFSIASLLFAVYATSGRIRAPSRRDIPGLVVMGVLGVGLYQVALNYGERTVPAGAASFLVGASPVVAAIGAALVLRERLERRVVAGAALSLAGLLVIAAAESGPLVLSPDAGLVVLAAIAQGSYFVLQKRFLGRYAPLELTAYAVWAGTASLLIWSPGLAHAVTHASSRATLAVIYLGIFPGAVAYFTYAYSMTELPVARAATFLYAVPVVSTLLAWAWLGEVPNSGAALGGMLTMAGVVIVNRRAPSGLTRSRSGAEPIARTR